LAKCIKIKYSEEEAKKLATELKKAYKKCFGNTHRQEKRSYLCPDCKSYHLTSMPQHVWDLIQKNKKQEKAKYFRDRDREVISILKHRALYNL